MLTHFMQALSEPLLIEAGFGSRLVSVFGRKLLGGHFTAADLHAELGVPMPEERQQRQRVGKVAVIPVVGVIANRAQSLGTSTQQIGAMVDRAVTDPDVVAILYDHDSPGGTVPGVPELAARIRAAAQIKPSGAIGNGLMASASYWLGAAVGKGNVWGLGSGEGAGSIGVWTVSEDWTKFLENEGIKITEIKAGKYKTEGAPWAPLTEEAQAFLQARVNEVYKAFAESVAEDRSDTAANVRAGYGEARVLSAPLAKKANLIDRIGTFEEAAEWLAIKATPRKRGPKAALLQAEEVGLQAALADATEPAFAVGDRVRALVNHMAGMAGRIGTVTEAHAGDPPYYAVRFDGEVEDHKWLAEDEIEPAENAEEEEEPMRHGTRRGAKASLLSHELDMAAARLTA